MEEMGKVQYLTELTLKTSIKIYKLGSFVKSVPFELTSRNSLRVQIFPQRWKRILWHISSWLLFLMCAFKWINFFRVFPTNEFGTEMAIHIEHIVGSLLFFVSNFALYLKPEECVFSMNQHDFIFRASPGLGLGKRHWASHPTVMLAVLYFSRMQILLALTLMATFIWKPNYSAFLYSVFPMEWKPNYLAFAICFALELGWTVWGLTTLLLFFCNWAANIFTLNPAIAELMKKKTLSELKLQAFIYLQIYVVLFNDYNRSFFNPGFNTAITITPVLFLFLTFTSFDSSSKVNITSRRLITSMQKQRIELIQQNRKGVMRSPGSGGLGSGFELLSTMRIKRNQINPSGVLEEYVRKRAEALQPMGIEISCFGCYTLGTSRDMMDQLSNNLLLLLSL